MSFNPNETATDDSGLFGLPFGLEKSRLILIPVPWEATTSYGNGTSHGPQAILKASHQVDLFDFEVGDVYRHGYHMLNIPDAILELNYEMKRKAFEIVNSIEAGRTPSEENSRDINDASSRVNAWVYTQAKEQLKAGKLIGVIGGDHSSPFGAIRAIAEACNNQYGILHIDAHADLRHAYQSFQHSHASIMHNVMESAFRPQQLVQVAIRDFSSDENKYIQNSQGRIKTFFEIPLKRRLHRGETWQRLCDEIVSALPDNVYISFDIDGLSPELCPNTGTPVPGGLSFDQATTLLASIAEHGKKIVGFDLCEVSQPKDATNEWDGNVGARLLFKLCGWTMITNGLKPTQAHQ